MDGASNDHPEDEALRMLRLKEEHDRYDRELRTLSQKTYLSQEEQVEEVRLKKLKLRAKDRISNLAGAVRA